MKKSTKPKAIWTTLRAGKVQLARAAKAKAAKREQKAVARRAAPRKRIPARSERGRERNAEYLKVRAVWMFLPDGGVRPCEACKLIDKLPGMTGGTSAVAHPASEPHHSRGREGKLLCDTRFWVAVCRPSHIWIDSNREKARELGLLCKVGEFNTQPKD